MLSLDQEANPSNIHDRSFTSSIDSSPIQPQKEIIHDLFAAQIVAYGSIVIDRPVNRDCPIGSTVREITPADDHRVDSQGRTFINGVAMDPGDSGSNHYH